MDYDNRIVAFIDILGFSSMIKQSETDPLIMEKLLKALKYLKNYESPEGWNLDTIEIEEDAQKRGVDTFKIEEKTNVTCFSDSIIVSVNLSGLGINEAISTLIANLSYIGAYLLTEGILVRGGITIGNLIHTKDGIVLGQALIDSYRTESNIAIFPRIVLSEKLLNQLNYPITSKRQRYPYHQYLNRFSDGCVGFHQLIFFQVIQSWTELTDDKLEENLRKAKKVIINGLDSCLENPNIYKKYSWLKKQYNDLIILTDNIKDPIRELNEGISGANIHYSYTDDFYTKRQKNIST